MLDDNDHRSLGQRLDLFHFQEEAPGMVFWHPNGLVLYRLLEDAVRSHFERAGYAEVRTPQVLRRPVWEASGHWKHFDGGMLHIDDPGHESALKPVSCPGHVYIAERAHLSYRDLPLRLAEFGCVHRDEPSGTLHGLLRLRQFTQDDGHVFCSEEQAPGEIERFCHTVAPFYAAFGFDDVQVALSTRPADRAGDDASWDRAEDTLRGVLGRLDWPYSVQEGGGAFYGPKLELALRDRLGRSWQCGTIQLDLVMPRRFDLRYVAPGGDKVPVVMLHRALYGSLERFLGMVLEHHGATLPPWLSPEQVHLLPVGDEHEPRARVVAEHLRDVGLRVFVVPARDSLARRIALAHERAVPFVGVIGAKEAASGAIAVRFRDGQRVLGLEAAAAELGRAGRSPFRR